MRKVTLLTAASIFALLAVEATKPALSSSSISDKLGVLLAPKVSKVLYNQNNNDAGIAITSENLTSGSSSGYSDQGADDFVIPKGRTWTITEVDITGGYSVSGPATSENVIFYQNAKGFPGKPIKNGTFEGLKGTGGPNFATVLPGKGINLKAGHYWLSVIANMDFPCCGLWGWEVNGTQNWDQALWRNPAGGYEVCRTWGTIERCDGSGPDFMFTLRGTLK